MNVKASFCDCIVDVHKYIYMQSWYYHRLGINRYMKNKYNWVEIQAYYDLGHSISEVTQKFGVTKQMCIRSAHFKSRPKEEQSKMMVSKRKERGTNLHSLETKQALSELAIARGFGGKNYRKTFEYRGILLESSYELALAKELDSNKVKWIRPKRMKWIDESGKQRHYTPDFYLPEFDVYLDSKNDYLIKIDSVKVRLCSVQNNVKIHVLNKSQLSWDYIAGLV